MKSKATDQCVYIVDDDASICDSLCMLMDSVDIAAQSFTSASDFFAQYDGGKGVLLLDVRMPGMSGIEMQERLAQEQYFGLTVVFMTGHGDVPMAVNALKKGAVDFLTKPVREQDLLDCVQRALASNGENIARRARADIIEARIDALTPREREVMVMIAEGQPNKVVALDLEISQRTVEIHRAHIMKKMCSQSVSQLVRSLDEVDYFNRIAPPRVLSL